MLNIFYLQEEYLWREKGCARRGAHSLRKLVIKRETRGINAQALTQSIYTRLFVFSHCHSHATVYQSFIIYCSILIFYRYDN